MVFVVFYVQEHPNAQPAVVLVLKRLRLKVSSDAIAYCQIMYNYILVL